MGLVPGRFLKRTLGRILPAHILQGSDNGQQNGYYNMNSSELETSGLQNKSSNAKIPVLPDGTQPVPIGSGVISKILGEGGAAILYEIRNSQLGFQRAIKLLKPNQTKESFNRFLKEFRIGAQLNHPNIVTVHSVGQWQKLPYIEMEKISGFTLSEIISQFGPLPLGLCTSAGIILCKVLEYISTCNFDIEKKKYKGLLHLDIKPANILLSNSGVLKVMDFGLATPIQEARLGLFPAGIGSPQHAAPELLFETGVPDIRSDLYSLGTILYEAASGTKTFPGSNPDKVFELRRENNFVPLKKILKTLPSEYIQLVECCLSFDMDERPNNIEFVRNQLEKIHSKCTCLTPESTVSLYISKRIKNEPFTLPKPKRSKTFYISGVLLLCLVALLSLGFWKQQETLSFFKPVIELFAPSKTATNDFSEQIPISFENTSSTPNQKENETTPFYVPSLNSKDAELMDSLHRLWSSRQYDDMLYLISTMPSELSNSKIVVLLKLRALGRNGDELGKFLEQNEIPDGEYYFHLARYYFGNKNYTEAIETLDKAETFPSEFLDKRMLGREVHLYKSRSLTALFRDTPTSENLALALDSWNKLLQLSKDRPNSLHFREAEREKNNLTAEASWRGILP